MKVFIATLAHETNSFSPIPTSEQNFRDGIYYHPDDNPDVDPADLFVGYSDFLRIARKRGDEPVLSLCAWAQPSAPIARAGYEAMRDRILADLRTAMPVDAVLLLLHGAQVAQGFDDPEGDVLARIRAIVGPDVPIGVELDLHCNLTDTMVENATAIIACKEYPHIDFPERAQELYDIIEATAAGCVRPTMALCRAPMLAKFHTTREPMRSLVDRTIALEGKDAVLSITLAHGFAWADIADAGSSVLVVTDNAPDKAAELAEKFARELFAMRGDVKARFCPMDQALDRALTAPKGPVVIADSSDNAGGGAASDSTFILRALIEREVDNVSLGMIWDPGAVQMAFAAGEGAEFAVRLGGKTGPASGDPIDAWGRVIGLHENPTQRGLDPKRPELMGASAALRIGGVEVVVNSIRQQVFSPDVFTELGINPAMKRLVVVKSSQHFHTLFASMASEVVYCDAPGALNSDLAANPYSKIRRPIWPLDDVEWGALRLADLGRANGRC